MGWSCGLYGKGSAYWIWVGKPVKKRPLGRPRSRWEDNIKIDLQEIGWGVDWIHLAQDKEGWRAVMNFRFPYNWGGHF
jgi:hypothetical protein